MKAGGVSVEAAGAASVEGAGEWMSGRSTRARGRERYLSTESASTIVIESMMYGGEDNVLRWIMCGSEGNVLR
jgi:hypothetical protein